MAPAPKPTRKTTTGNRYTSAPPPKSNPRIVGRYKIKPTKVPKGLVLKKRGGGKGYVTVRAATPAPGAAGAPGAATPATPKVNTYPEYAGYPAAQRALADIDRDQAFGLAEAQKVGDWLKGGLTALTGVDPSNPGLNPTLQQQYLGNVQRIVGGTLGAATAGAAGPQVNPTTAGAIAVSPTAYLSQAAQQGNIGRSSAMLQQAQIQATLNTLQPNTQAQAYMRSYADMQAGLPAIYAQRRSEARMKIDEFIEEMRHNKVSEATSAWNAQTNAAIAAGRLGLDASKFGADQAADTAAASTPAPAGYLRDPATGKLYRDPSVPQATSGGSGGGRSPAPSAARGQYVPNKLRKEGYVGGWKVKPKGVKGPFVKATDGTFWRKPGSSGSGSTKKPKTGTNGFDVQKDLTYSLDNGFIDGTDAGKSIPQLVRFLRKHQPESPAAFAKWWGETGAILKEEDPNLFIWMRDYITRRRRDRTWKGHF